MRRLAVMLGLVLCATAHAAPPIVWLSLSGTPRVMTQDEALTAIAAGGRVVAYARPDATAPVVVGLGDAAPSPGPAPGPTPTPTPPTPTPPQPVGDVRVILVYDSTDNMTAEQTATMYGPRVKDFLNRKCVKEGMLEAWRRWDRHIDTAKETPTWRALWDAVKPALTTFPAVVVVRGQQGQVYPMPATEADTLALLKRLLGE